MTEIRHISDREMALERENARLVDKTERQSATIHVQAVAIQAMQADKKLLDELLQVLDENGKDDYSDETAITYMNMYVGEAAMKESK